MQLQVKKLPWYLSWKGLLATKKPKAIYFTTRFGIHTFGMRYPIDVLILDNEGVVRKLKENLQPNRFFFWNPYFDSAVELPAGTIAKEKLKCGAIIQLQTF